MAYLLRLVRTHVSWEVKLFMNRLFWLLMGMMMGAAAYHYYREQGGSIPDFDTLQETGRGMFETAKSRASAVKGDVQRMREDVRDDLAATGE
jgi:hypothetical protein